MRNKNLCIIIQTRSGNFIFSSKKLFLYDTVVYGLILKLVSSGITGYDMKLGARMAKVHRSHFNAYKPGKFEGLSYQNVFT